MVNMKKSTSLSTVLVITSIVIAVVIVCSVGGVATYHIKDLHHITNLNYEAAMYDGYRTEIKSQVQVALSILQSLHQQELDGILTT